MVKWSTILTGAAVAAIAAPLLLTSPARATDEEPGGGCVPPFPFGHCCDCYQVEHQGTKCSLTHDHASSECSATCHGNDCQT
jgi:hypothetical protein